MTDFKKLTLALATAGLLSSAAVQAALFDRGSGLIYDDVLNITWLADTNYARTNGYDSDGWMGFSAANTWAANLVYYDSVRNVRYDDWRLPTVLNQDGTNPCYVISCISGELGHMYFNNLGAENFFYQFPFDRSYSEWHLTNPANVELFTSLSPDAMYWTNTVYVPNPPVDSMAGVPDPANSAWAFALISGVISGHTVVRQQDQFKAWAVRPGDVASPVPEPETYALLLAGLGLLGGVAKWRRGSFGVS